MMQDCIKGTSHVSLQNVFCKNMSEVHFWHCSAIYGQILGRFVSAHVRDAASEQKNFALRPLLCIVFCYDDRLWVWVKNTKPHFFLFSFLFFFQRSVSGRSSAQSMVSQMLSHSADLDFCFLLN